MTKGKCKPTKWGYKQFVLENSSTGYTWNFFVYMGKRESTTGQELSYSLLMKLLPVSLNGRGLHTVRGQFLYKHYHLSKFETEKH